MKDTLKDLIKRHEGLRLKPYVCSAGKLSIGYGRNLDDRGITLDEADYLLDNDIGIAISQCLQFAWFGRLSENRQAVVASMVFNLGFGRFKAFKKTIAYIEAGRYSDAATEMLDSKWADQVGPRADELARMMDEG